MATRAEIIYLVIGTIYSIFAMAELSNKQSSYFTIFGKPVSKFLLAAGYGVLLLAAISTNSLRNLL